MTTLGERFVRALAAKDFAGVAAVLHPQVDFRGMTPGRFWEATGPDQVVGQQAFYSATGDRIGWMRVMCSGFRPAAPG
jgi:hypothetical protein